MSNTTPKKKSTLVEAYGHKGMKRTPWQRVFKSAEALTAWLDKNDAEVLGYAVNPGTGR